MLNFDGFCEELKAPKCTSGQNTYMWFGMVDNLALNYMIFSMPEGNGCNECENGYVSVYQSQ